MKNFVNKILPLVITYWLPFVIWALIIYSFSASPTVKTSEVHWQDFIVKKSAHLVEYFIFSMLLYRALINSGIKSKYIFFFIVFTAFIYGAADEFHQSFTPSREPRMRDVLIDTAGSILFVWSMKNIIMKKEKLLRLAKMVQLVR